MTRRPFGIFVTGTDTGVGKTLVSVSLVKALALHGLRVAAMKPIASGSEQTPAGLRNSDALALAAAANVPAPYATVNPYCFEPAISPQIAAEEAKVVVDPGVIRDSFQALAGDAEVVVVEGAGGWYAPFSATESMADLPKLLEIPVLLVVGLRLGCVNHALLTKQAVEASGAELAGWVANRIDPALERPEANLSTLQSRLGREPLAVFPFEPQVPAAAPAPTAPRAPVAPQSRICSQAPAAPQSRVGSQAPAAPGAALQAPPPHVRCGEHLGRRLCLISF